MERVRRIFGFYRTVGFCFGMQAADDDKLPLVFKANRGQTCAPLKLLARGRGYTIFFTGNDAVLSLTNQQLLRMHLAGINPKAKIKKEDI
jgi:hypothetical protein